MTDPTNVLVVGGGLAGVRTAERLRARGYSAGITLLAAEPHAPYDRPPLSKQVLRGGTDATTLRSAAELAELGVDVRLGDPATGLDPAARSVVTASGAKYAYDAVVIATGARPRRLPDLGGLVLRTIEDAHELRGRLSPGSTLTVIGAGLIGCEVAAGARALGVEVDLVDLAPGPMVRVVGPTVATHIAQLHRDHGVRMHLGTRVTRDADGGLRTEDGTLLGSGTVLQAIGAEPVTDWLTGSGLPLCDGVVCDADGRAAEGVYAVGDVARWDGHRSEHWTAGVHQADHVAAVLLGRPPVPAEAAYWWSDQYDVKIQGIGSPGAGDRVDLVVWGPRQRPVAVYSDAGTTTA
ncbi:NAD(P)/FAD-dependent oxidoreductase, partial [Streptomyces sp. NPDC059766]|uniref:NAD(P)/FAD-dependent oxidoreductase n=1 Tax=Streptomyces sp. NPDC059766 TaxID=3346940 RepID=UPI003667F55E